jgi:hypothetical protein
LAAIIVAGGLQQRGRQTTKAVDVDMSVTGAI